MEIFINGEIHSGIVPEIKDALRRAGGRPVTVRINSEGGEVISGLAIFDALRAYSGKVTAIVESASLSMASAIMLACDEIRATPNALVMVHNVHGGGEELTPADEALIEKLNAKLVSIYSSRTGMGREEIIALMEAETFLDAEESIEYGFVDAIEQPTKRVDHHVARIAAASPAYAKAVASAKAKAATNLESVRAEFNQAVAQAYREGVKLDARLSWIDAKYPGLRQRYVRAANRR